MKNLITNHKTILIAILSFIIMVIIFVSLKDNKEQAKTMDLSPTTADTTNPLALFEQPVMPKMDLSNSMTLHNSVDFANTIGLSVGGAKDINNFRENIKHGYLPSIDDITYEGLFYDYYFETGNQKSECDALFCPSYTYAISQDPITQKDEYFLSVGLNSNIKKSDFKRKKLNLMVVLDRSGSMGSEFDKYHYDKYKKENLNNETEETHDSRSKLTIAKETITDIIKHLDKGDKFGFVVFDTESQVIVPLKRVNKSYIPEIKNKILSVDIGGGTSLESGFKEASNQFNNAGEGKNEFENRIIILSDEMPNTGMTDEEELLDMIKSSAKEKVYTTFIGIGIDFNASLTESISKVNGANYYSVHSSKEFKNRLDDEFEYMVTPLVYNLRLTLISDGFEIEKIYGSPEANESTGEVMRVNTLFPSDKKDEQTKGGIIIVRLRKTSGNPEISLKVSYEDRAGKISTNRTKITLAGKKPGYYENTGIRKAILLSRYADLMKLWLGNEKNTDKHEAAGNKGKTIVLKNGSVIKLNKWERQSQELFVPAEYKELFGTFKKYYETEMTSINDSTLKNELEVLDSLIN